jgi:uncharacterized membrane protein YfcA
MGEIASYFARERYIKWRLSLLSLTGMAVLVPIALAAGARRIPASVLWWAVIAFVACVAVVVVLILQRARAKFPKSAAKDSEPLDEATRKKLVRRIRFLQVAFGVYALALVYGFWEALYGPHLPVLTGVVMNLLLEAVLWKTIRRLQKKLKQAMNPTIPTA